MHKSRLGGILIDCQTEDPEPAAEFWAAALGYPPKPRDPATPYVDLDTPARELYTVVQAVEHESRVHIDIETDDIEAEVRRLAGLGAREIGRSFAAEAALAALVSGRSKDLALARKAFAHTAAYDGAISNWLGAREIGRIKSWVILEAPTGQRFCVVPVESAHFDDTANSWE